MMTTMVSTSLNPMVPIPPIPPPPPAGSHTGGYSSINNGNGNGNDDGNSSRRGATTPSLKRRAAATATVTATAAVVSSTTATSNIHDPSTTRCTTTTTTTTSSSSTSTSSSTSSCCLDCRSLQSSLKRVRLSCSPGELRLQRDLLALPSTGWQTLEEGSRWYLSTPASTSRNGRSSSSSNNSNSGSGSSGSSHAPSHRRWEAELHVLDPLRLVLQVQLPCSTSTSTSGSAMTPNLPLPSPSPPRVGRIWIQIPRMYPHRPPVISRMEDVWMERMVIVDAPFLTGNSAAAHESSMTTQTTPQSSLSLVVVYNQWSPVRTLGELLEFVLETATIEPSPAVLSLLSSSSSSSRAVHSVRHNPSSPLSTLAPTASSSSSSPSSSPRSPKGAAAMMGPLHDATSTTTTSTNSTSGGSHSRSRSRSHHLSLFSEEHKMDERHTLPPHYHHDHPMFHGSLSDATTTTTEPLEGAGSSLAPNRFDVGYDKRFKAARPGHPSVSAVETNHTTTTTPTTKTNTMDVVDMNDPMNDPMNDQMNDHMNDHMNDQMNDHDPMNNHIHDHMNMNDMESSPPPSLLGLQWQAISALTQANESPMEL